MKFLVPLFTVCMLALLSSCQPTAPAAPEASAAVEPSTLSPGMIKVSILYPNGEGHTFDMDYYANTHMPMVAKLFGDSLKSYRIDLGVGGRTPEDPIPYLAVGTFYFEQLSAYQNSFGPHAEKIRSDIPNYTNIQPQVLISEVVK
ncbi:MAG: EthD family reductase [Bacteroidota bacterium]